MTIRAASERSLDVVTCMFLQFTHAWRRLDVHANTGTYTKLSNSSLNVKKLLQSEKKNPYPNFTNIYLLVSLYVYSYLLRCTVVTGPVPGDLPPKIL